MKYDFVTEAEAYSNVVNQVWTLQEFIEYIQHVRENTFDYDDGWGDY